MLEIGMVYGILLDVVVVIHAAFVLFAVLGALIVYRKRRMIWLHIPAVVWAAMIEFAGWICPLTPLEDRLRGNTVMGYGYLERYIMPILYPESLTRPIQFVLGAGVLAINVILYWIIITRSLSSRAPK